MYYIILKSTQKAFDTLDDARKAFRKLSYSKQQYAYIVTAGGTVVE